MKKLLSLLVMLSIFVGGLTLADCVDIDVDDGNSYSFCILKAKSYSSKFSISVDNAENLSTCTVGKGGQTWDFSKCEGDFSLVGDLGISYLWLTIKYNNKEYNRKEYYDFTKGIFTDKNGNPLSSVVDNTDTENDDIGNNTEDNNSEDDNSEDDNSEDDNSEDDNSEDDNSEDDNSEDDNSEDDNIGDNDNEDDNIENDNIENDNIEDNNAQNGNVSNSVVNAKNTTLKLTTNNKSPEVKEYVNLTIETDEDYTDRLLLSVKYRSSSSSSWSSIKNTSSTYFLDYSDDWDNGYYKMKSSNYGEITLKNLVKFKKSGSYRIYVKDTDGNEEYVTFNVYEEDENLIKDTNEIKDENQKQENKKNVNKYNNVEDYNSKIGEITNKCYAEEIRATNYYYSGTIDELKKGVNSVISTCRDVKSDLEDMGGWDGDTSFVDGAIAIIEKIVDYYEAYNKIMPFFDKEINNLSENEKKEYNSIIDELNNIESDLALLENNIYYIQDRFARREGYYTIPCSIEGTKYSDELTIAYEWACLNGITTISDINSAGLDQPLTRAQLAKMMSLFKYNILQEKPHLKPQIVYSDVSSSLGDLEGYIQIAYDYGIMGIDKDGNAIENFNPNGTLNRGDFATVFSRSLWGNKYNKEGADYYSNHLNALKNGGYMNNIDPKVLEIRGYVMLMMYRASQNISNEATSWTSLNSLIKKTTSNNTSANTSSNTSSKQTNSNQVSTSKTHEEAVAAAYGNRAGASAGAIRAQQNEAYNRAVAGNTVDTSKCGSYNPYGGESYGGWLNRCQNGGSITDTYKINTNSNDKMYEALSNYIKSSNGLSTSSNSLYNKDQYDYLNDFVGALNASTNTYTPKINLGQNKKDYSVNRAINAINSARGGYSPTINLSIGKDINRNIKF